MRQVLVVGLAVMAAGTLTACAVHPPPATASGRPEYTFRNVDPACVRARLVDSAINRRWQPRNVTDWQIIMERPTQNAAAGILLSSRMYSEVMERVTITTTPSGPDSLRAVFSMAYVGNPGSAFERLTPVNGTANDQAALEQQGPAVEAACRREQPAPAPSSRRR